MFQKANIADCIARNPSDREITQHLWAGNAGPLFIGRRSVREVNYKGTMTLIIIIPNERCSKQFLPVSNETRIILVKVNRISGINIKTNKKST